MPRSERPLDPGDTPLVRLAGDLRGLRRKAGNPTYRELAERTHYSVSTLSGAAGGRKLPTLGVVLAYVTACDGDREEWERRWHEVARELAPDLPADWPAGEAGSPYVGLAAFQADDADRFFGREALVAEVLTAVRRQSVVAVFGASGAGKSSLLRAGVLPRLRADPRHAVVLFTPGADPVEECAIALSRLDGRLPGPVRAELATDRRGLHRVVRHTLSARPEGTTSVLVIDQFEEIFTLTTDAGERELFIDSLCEAAADTRRCCRVVLGVRADFYAHCTAFPRLAEILRGGQVIVGPMTADELRRTVTQPAVRLGYAVETPLLTELVAQATGQIGVLPLLSHALLETWRRRRGNTLTLDGFRAAGGMDGALSKTAESVWSGLPPAARGAAKHLMLRLTAVGDGTQDTKRRISPEELDDDPDTRLVVGRFAEARLIAVDRDAIEISHEALIRSWPRLRDWLAEDRDGLRLHRELTSATEAWQAVHRDRGALYRGVRLARAQEWAARDGAALSRREREFLTASSAAERADRIAARRSRSRLRRAVALLSVLLVLVVAATGYAIVAGRSAAVQRDTALSEVVATKAALLRPTQPVLAAQLSLAAYRLAPTAEARSGLLAAVPFPNGRRLAGHAGNVNSVRFSPDGRLVVTASHDGTARLWKVADLRRPTPYAVLTGHAGTVNDAVFRPDGRVVATAGWDHTARLWDVSQPRRPVLLAVLGGHADDVNSVAFSPDGRRLATASTDRTVRLWDVANPQAPAHVATLSGHTSTVVTVAFRPGGGELATGGFDRRVGLWKLADPRHPRFLTGHRAPVTWVAFGPDGSALASSGQDETVMIWDAATGRATGRLSGHRGVVRSVAFSPDGRAVATAGRGPKDRPVVGRVPARRLPADRLAGGTCRGGLLGRRQPGRPCPRHWQRRRHGGAVAAARRLGAGRSGPGGGVDLRARRDPRQRPAVGGLFSRGRLRPALPTGLIAGRPTAARLGFLVVLVLVDNDLSVGAPVSWSRGSGSPGRRRPPGCRGRPGCWW
nr:hypothetical protein [Actinoplanes sp. ATCC 53533]